MRAVHPEQNPWHDPMPFAVGTLHECPIMLVLDYGCFVELRPEVWGLLKLPRYAQTHLVCEV